MKKSSLFAIITGSWMSLILGKFGIEITNWLWWVSIFFGAVIMLAIYHKACKD